MTLIRMAAGYRRSCELLRERMNELKERARTAQPPEKGQLEQRIKDLNTLYRETRETAVILERYYSGNNRRCHARQKRR